MCFIKLMAKISHFFVYEENLHMIQWDKYKIININMNISPQIQNLDERHVAYVSYTGNYSGNAEIFGMLFSKLCGWAAPKGLLNDDAVMLSSYQDDHEVTPLDELSVDVCITAPEDIEISGEIGKKTLPGGQYVVTSVELTGPQEYGPAWQEVAKWVKENGYKIDMSRPSYEIYKNDPTKHPQGHHILDICASVK